MTNPDFSQELAAIGGYLDAAQEVLKSGFMPDITGLEKRVSMLCEALQQQPQDAQKQYVGQLAALVEKLNNLDRDMRAFHTSRIAAGSA